MSYLEAVAVDELTDNEELTKGYEEAMNVKVR